MARIEGTPKPRGIFQRIVFWFVKKKIGRVVAPVRIHAHHPQVFSGYARMEMGQDKAKRVPFGVKALASIRVATRIGCPF